MSTLPGTSVPQAGPAGTSVPQAGPLGTSVPQAGPLGTSVPQAGPDQAVPPAGTGGPERAGGGARPVLGRQVGGALAWSFLNNVVSRIATVLSGIVLARILAPADYGIFAVALVVLGAALSMNELGVSLAVVRWKDGVERIAPTVTTLAIVWSAALYAACYLAAPRIAVALNAPDAVTMIRILSSCVLVDAVAAVPSALITRHFLQRTRMVIDLVSFAVGTGLSIVLAVLGHGAWAIVWGFALSNVLAGVLAFVLAPARYRPGFDRAVARTLLGFGLPLAGSSLVMFLMLNVDYVVVGHELGSVELGLYLLAFNLCSWPVNLVSVAVRRVSFAGFSRVADDGGRQAGAAFTRSAGLVAAVTVPMCVYLAVFAVPTITLLYGPRWLASADVLRLLCALGALRVALELVYDYLVAVGRARANLYLQVLWVAVLIPALVVGARAGGIEGVAAAHSLVAAVVVLPAALGILRRSHVPLRVLAGRLWRPLVAGGAVALAGWGVLALTPVVLLQLALGGLMTLAVCALVYAPLRSELRLLAPGRAQGPAATPVDPADAGVGTTPGVLR